MRRRRSQLLRRGEVWLRRQCGRLTPKQQTTVVYLLSGIYLVVSLYMMAQLFIKKCDTPAIIREGETLWDSPIELKQPDSIASVVATQILAMEQDNFNHNLSNGR